MAKEKVYKFTDPAKPAKSLVVLLKIAVILSLAAVLSTLNELNILHQLKNKSFSSEEAIVAAANRSDLIEIAVGSVQIIVSGIILIVFLRWMYRAAANNQAWKIENITQKPHWGWLNFIIPVWSLFKPYEFFREIWNAVEFKKDEPENWKTLPGPGCLKIFWAMFLISNLLGRATFRLGMKAESFESLINLDWLCLTNEMVDMVQNLALIVLVSGIMERQKIYSEKLSAENPAENA